MINIIMLALFVEAIVSAVKPIWTKGEGMTVTEIVSICVGVLMAVVLKIDLFGIVADISYDVPDWFNYVFYAMTGIAIGRGPSFVYDLWEALKKWGDKPESLDTPGE